MSRIPIALQLYSVRDDSAKDFAATIQKVAEIGYEAVEFAGYHGYSAAELRKLLDDNGLKCAGTHTQLPTLLGDELKKTADFMAEVGSPNLIVPHLSPETYAGREGAKRMGDVLSAAAIEAEKFGAFVGYHNHAWEFKPVEDGGIPMDIAFEDAHPSVICQIDTGNAQEGAGSPVPVIEKYKSRVKTVHLKPFARDFSKYFIGEDETDWNAVFAALEGSAAEYYIVEQERYPEPNSPFDCVARCLKNLKAMGK
jgi:sugar phosphate isomerase/epimerase